MSLKQVHWGPGRKRVKDTPSFCVTAIQNQRPTSGSSKALVLAKRTPNPGALVKRLRGGSNALLPGNETVSPLGLHNQAPLTVPRLESEIKVWTGLVSPEASVLGLQAVTSHCVLTGPFFCAPASLTSLHVTKLPLFIRTPVRLD